MAKKTGKQLITKGYKYIAARDTEKAIRTFVKLIKGSSNQKLKMFGFLGLGDVLRVIHEIERAEKMYEKAMILAEIQENTKMIQHLDERIETGYIFKKDPNLNPVQIEFFMRSIIKLLSTLGKDDWF
ncbi:MAG: hypothetical protein ACTSSI_11960 [Candidatus Helarchaeota archaeon]